MKCHIYKLPAGSIVTIRLQQDTTFEIEEDVSFSDLLEKAEQTVREEGKYSHTLHPQRVKVTKC